ncbi:predicted protein [Plenodomus lingam JN3]|uniref:Predicted protein n=1 Tax=Leptosphaeria maculans (strain JN3 / isolate v23.1.3 / race Av1-4-5-6-7-8) TaxID=985895 RepID=E4ZJN6_LEPMJ|nr:predicted protein [Plenodomus lingam JN3]CBX91321.1 predicted protein [Plenodomus lingam JN3]
MPPLRLIVLVSDQLAPLRLPLSRSSPVISRPLIWYPSIDPTSPLS